MSSGKVGGLAVGIVIGMIMLAMFALEQRSKHRRTDLIAADFPVGTPRSEVVAKLGAPQQEAMGSAARTHPFDPACNDMVAHKVTYTMPEGGPYLSVYLDSRERVICIEHGSIAYN